MQAVENKTVVVAATQWYTMFQKILLVSRCEVCQLVHRIELKVEHRKETVDLYLLDNFHLYTSIFVTPTLGVSAFIYTQSCIIYTSSPENIRAILAETLHPKLRGHSAPFGIPWQLHGNLNSKLYLLWEMFCADTTSLENHTRFTNLLSFGRTVPISHQILHHIIEQFWMQD